MTFAALIFYLSFFGGAIGLFAKWALVAFTPLTIICVRLFISLIIFTGLLIKQKRLGAVLRALKTRMGYFLLLAFSGVICAMGISFVGIPYTTAINYNLIFNLGTLSIFPFAVLLLKEKCRLSDFIFLVIAFAGATIIGTGGTLPHEILQSLNKGDLFIAIGALGWALYSVLGARLLRDNKENDPFSVLFGSFLLGALLLVPFALAQPSLGVTAAAIGVRPLLGILLLSIFSTAILFYLWFLFVKTYGGAWGGLVAFSENISGIVLPVLFLSETLTAPTMIGGGVIIGAVIAKECTDARRRRQLSAVKKI
jgi:drug/metabolite transporter (DMT)-like permease